MVPIKRWHRLPHVGAVLYICLRAPSDLFNHGILSQLQSWVPLDVQVTFTLVGPVSPVLFGGSACSLVPGAAVAFRPVLGLAPRAPRLSPVFRLRLYSPSTAGL